jgi:predicted transcriptional regulator
MIHAHAAAVRNTRSAVCRSDVGALPREDHNRTKGLKHSAIPPLPPFVSIPSNSFAIQCIANSLKGMSESITTSIRLTPKLRSALELKAKREKRGKNWIISRALESYLQQDGLTDLKAEAKRQSLIAAQQHEEDWSEDADLAQWK